MTDNEIIKALECCRDCNCKECPACRIIDGGTYCTEIDEEEILDLINRQKAEIERLAKYRKEEIEKIMSATDRIITETKAEAIKEFAERLTDKICENVNKSLDNPNGYDYYPIDVYTDIDNLVKEMEGDTE